ncbi:MAG: acetamidase, partial [Mesorhizobium sp.]
MCNNCDYTIHGRHHHFGWDNSFVPTERVAPGSTIEFQCLDSSGGQLTLDSTVDDVALLDFAKVNPVTGPIYVDGAEPGDALKITIEAFKPSGFGWTANIPGFGLLADDFPEPALNIWTYDAASLEPALFGKHARVPLKPFAGTIGNAPAEMGLHSVVPPRRVGGNLDIRDLAAGTTLYLPVEVAGALFSVGDTHAAQGDGEVCGTAIESPMDVVLKLDLVKDARLKTPRFTTPGPVTRHIDAKGYEVTTGIGPDLMTG